MGGEMEPKVTHAGALQRPSHFRFSSHWTAVQYPLETSGRVPTRMLENRRLATQPVTPLTATALQYQWTQLMPPAEPSDAELKQRLAETTRLSLTPVPEEDDGEEEEPAEEEPKPVPWQSTRDLPDRRVMVQRILTLTERRHRTVVPAAAPTPVQAFLASQATGTRQRERRNTGNATAATSAREGATALAKRIELSLYSRAGSLEEYRNTATLRRRLQSLVSLSFHEAAATREDSLQPVAARPSGGKRQRPTLGMVVPAKRRRTVDPTWRAPTLAISGHIIGPLPEDCLRTVFSFLDGRQTMSLRCLNRLASALMPSCVYKLEVEIGKLHQCFLAGQSYSTLCAMVNLERLIVFKSINPCAEPTSPDQKHALHAWGCSELDVSHNNLGEVVIKQLASALDAGAGSRLRQLQIVSSFTNTSRRNSLRALCHVLSRGACPLLQDLLLGGNSITDAGSADVARLLESRALTQLTRLDLRRNYIGECGLRRLMAALASSPSPMRRLKYLCLGGNLITDNCVEPLRDVLASGACPQMRFLGLEDNFLSPEGVQTIIQAAVSGGMVPKLHRVSSDGGIMTE